MKNQRNIQTALALFAVLLNLSFVAQANADTFTNTGSMTAGRTYVEAILLTNGNVLVVGGYNASNLLSAELYDPNTQSWRPTGSPKSPRLNPMAALLLPNGKVLVAGGQTATNGSYGYSSAELYDPATANWTNTSPMNAAIFTYNQVATPLPNSKVLVMGGQGSNGVTTSSAELYDPANGSWVATNPMHTNRIYHTSTLLRNGKVLVAGGANSTTIHSSAELYDPATESWTMAGTNFIARVNHTATLLPNGKVLVAGGHTSMSGYAATATTELYDPASNLWTTNTPMHTSRFCHTATLLPNGKVLVTGGMSNSISSAVRLSDTELYDPATGSWTTNGSMNFARTHHSATLLTNGNVLLAGGWTTGNAILTNAELYTSVAFQITAQPQSQFKYWGQSVSFSVNVTNGYPPLTYQWLENSVAVSGATNALLTLNNLQTTNAGVYSVVITDAGGNMLTSQPATLTVNTAGVSIALYAGVAGVAINGVVGQSYGIQTATNLTNTNSWVGAANLILTTPTQIWYDPQPATQAQRFFRVVPGPILVP